MQNETDILLVKDKGGNVLFGVQGDRDADSYSVIFFNRSVPPSAQRGQYRGRGNIVLSDTGLCIVGRHTRPFWMKYLIGFPVFYLLYLIIGSFWDSFSWLMVMVSMPLSLWVSYWLVEYALLKRETVFVPWSSIKNYCYIKIEGRGLFTGFIGITFDGYKNCSPVAFGTTHNYDGRLDAYAWKNVLHYLRDKIPELEIK
jgi:hypothetical protein